MPILLRSRFIALISLSLMSSFAQAAIVTQDSTIHAPGLAPAGARWILIQIRKGDNDQPSSTGTLTWTPGSTIPTVYLNGGPGHYQISYFVSKSEIAKGYQEFSTVQVENKDQRDGTYLFPSITVQSDAPEITALAKEITKEKQDTLEKSLAIHDWVATHIDYDDEERKLRERDGESAAPQDALSVLRLRHAVCEGYSNLTAALHRAIGIRSRVIYGKFEYASKQAFEILSLHGRSLALDQVPSLHAWNENLIDGHWMPMDTTEDAGEDSGKGWSRGATIKHDFANPDPPYFDFTHKKIGIL